MSAIAVGHDDSEQVTRHSELRRESGLGFLKRLDSELSRNSDLAGLERALELTVEHFEATSGVLLLSNRNELQNELQVVASCGKRGPAGWQERARDAAIDSEAVWFDPWHHSAVRPAGTNALRHSEAQCINVELGFEEETLLISIDDDGVGFDDSKRLQDRGHLGLINIDERARALGGEVAVESRPGFGTVIRVRIPSAVTQDERVRARE